MLLFLGSSKISGGRVIGSGDGTRKGLREILGSFHLPQISPHRAVSPRAVRENQLELLPVFLMSSEPLPRKPRSL